jgi:hypothetical protein
MHMPEKATAAQIDAASKAAAHLVLHCPHAEKLKELLLNCISNKRGSFLGSIAANLANNEGLATGRLQSELKNTLKDQHFPTPLKKNHLSGQQQAEAAISHAVGLRFFADEKILIPKNQPVFAEWFDKNPTLAKHYREMALTDHSIKPQDVKTSAQLAERWCSGKVKFDAAKVVEFTEALLGAPLPQSENVQVVFAMAATGKRSGLHAPINAPLPASLNDLPSPPRIALAPQTPSPHRSI